MTYSNSGNLGDHIQTLATLQYINAECGIERDILSLYNGEKVALLMQGWFGNCKKFPNMFPPSDKIFPIFVGFHISNTQEDRAFYAQNHIVNYLKKFEPIGCRDIDTMLFLKQFGINTYFSRCLTTTFPTRTVIPNKEKIFIVDCISDDLIPADILNKAERLTHFVSENESEIEKVKKANNLLKKYKEEATLVITSRLHCASPCIAMGVPVIFIEDKKDIRFTAISDLIEVHHVNRFLFRFKILKPIQKIYAYFFKKRVDWNPSVKNIDNTKQEIIKNVKQKIKDLIK